MEQGKLKRRRITTDKNREKPKYRDMAKNLTSMGAPPEAVERWKKINNQKQWLPTNNKE